MARHSHQDPFTGRFAKKPGRFEETVTWRLGSGMQREAERISREFRFRLAGKNGLVYKTNEASIEWMKKTAIGKLNAKIAEHGNPQVGRTHKLEKLIRKNKFHEVTQDGWRFMVESEIRAQMKTRGQSFEFKGVNYALSLEYGDDTWVDKYQTFAFLGRNSNRRNSESRGRGSGDLRNRANDRAHQLRGAHRPNPTRSSDPDIGARATHGSGFVADRILGPREWKSRKSAYFQNARRYRVIIRRPVPEYRYGRDAGADFRKYKVYKQLLLQSAKAFEAATQAKIVENNGAQAAVPKQRKRNPLKGRGKNSDVTVSNIND